MAQYTIDEVRQHKFPHDMWIVYSGKVYDITRFFDDHPGGTETLVDNAGTDATSAFDDIGHSSEAKDSLHNYYIGDLVVEKPKPSAAASVTASSDDGPASLSPPDSIPHTVAEPVPAHESSGPSPAAAMYQRAKVTEADATQLCNCTVM